MSGAVELDISTRRVQVDVEVPSVIVNPAPSDAAAWWDGEGPPATIVGSKPNDYYLDTLTGVVYKLK